MAALLTNARDFVGDEAMLRLRFYRAPPRAVARSAAGSPPIVFVVALADEHGDDASLPGVGVACGVEGGAAAADVDVVGAESYKAADLAAGAGGDIAALAEIDYKEKTEAQVRDWNAWNSDRSWWEALKRAGYAPSPEPPAKKARCG